MIRRALNLLRRFLCNWQQELRREHDWLALARGRTRTWREKLRALWECVIARMRKPARAPDLRSWLDLYRPTERLLDRFRSRAWPAEAPLFTVVIHAGKRPAKRLADTLRSLERQTYPHWRAVRAAEVVRLPEVSRLPLPAPARGQAHGDYLCWVRQGDVLEPHALHRFAEAILQERPDAVCGDGVTTGDDLNDIRAVRVLTQSSLDRLCNKRGRPGVFAVRAKLLDMPRRVTAKRLLRALARARTVTHVPDILFRARKNPVVPRRRRTRFASRTAPWVPARRDCHSATASKLGLFYPRRGMAPDDRGPRVGVIIPTRDRSELLLRCVESLEATVAPEAMRLHIVDHESRTFVARNYLRELGRRHQVTGYAGPFNFSALVNFGVARLEEPCDYYLFLNNDVEALRPGWLDSMLHMARRPDVGAVGALLLYPDGGIQHAGVVLGPHFGADNIREQSPYTPPLTCPERSAVTGACLLMPAQLFHALGGFDERFVVGFGDVDLCLRARQRGCRIMLDANAVLLHHESATRGKSVCDPHPDDTRRLRIKHQQAVVSDPFYSPLLARFAAFELNPLARAGVSVACRTVKRTPTVPARRRRPGLIAA